MMKYIHLLYVPTMACNMRCRYCYLENQTVEMSPERSPLDTLVYAVDKLLSAGVMPFNISLHGGEVTTLPPREFREVVRFISEYYRTHRADILAAGFKVGSPHIKTNLYWLDRHIDTIREFNVSVSGSLDLPLSLHDEYRLDKRGLPTRDKILRSVALMRDIPNRKKVSATIFKQHYDRMEEIIQDIWTLHRETCLDMNDFNFMVGFDFQSNGFLTPLTQEEQVDFYRRMQAAFRGTELGAGLETAWFAEFGPDYCTNCDNCGDKFFLLERNGDMYSCVRGQKHSEFYYGNIFRDSVGAILARANARIAAAHERVGFSPECAECGWLYLCKTGCPFVKKLYHTPQSYTCLLQKALYADRNLPPDQNNAQTVFAYLAHTHPAMAADYAPPRIPAHVPPLQEIIARDDGLKYIYASDAFILQIDDRRYPLFSQLLRITRDYVCVTPESTVVIYVRQEVMLAEAAYPVNNALYIQALSGEMIGYGDEGRMKQRHIMNEMIYLGALEDDPSDLPGYYKADISHIFRRYGPCFSHETANNLFFTTSALRDYHYAKQKNNAFYHMQAMDLPFQNIEFYYLVMDEGGVLTDEAGENVQ